MKVGLNSGLNGSDKFLLWWEMAQDLKIYLFGTTRAYGLSKQEAEDILYESLCCILERNKDNETSVPNKTYLKDVFRGVLLDYVRSMQRYGKVIYKKIRQIEDEVKKTSKSLADVLESMGMTMDEWHELKISQRDKLIVTPNFHRDITQTGTNRDGHTTSLMDFHFSDDKTPETNIVGVNPDIVNQSVSDKLSEFFETLISLLDTRLTAAFYLHYCENFSLFETGKFLGLTESRVCQLFTNDLNIGIFTETYDALDGGVSFEFGSEHVQFSPTQIFEMVNLFSKRGMDSLSFRIGSVDIEFGDILQVVSDRIKVRLINRITKESGKELAEKFNELLQKGPNVFSLAIRDENKSTERPASLLDAISGFSGDLRAQLRQDLQ